MFPKNIIVEHTTATTTTTTVTTQHSQAFNVSKVLLPSRICTRTHTEESIVCQMFWIIFKQFFLLFVLFLVVVVVLCVVIVIVLYTWPSFLCTVSVTLYWVYIFFLTTTKRPRRGRAKQVTNLYVCMYMYIRCAIFQESRRVSVIWKPAFVIMAYFLFVFFS